MSELMHVYDVVIEKKESTASGTEAKSTKNDLMVDNGREEGFGQGSEGKDVAEEKSTITKGMANEGAITCNSTEMVREKCQISEGKFTY